ncbi:hypothetical protein BH09BAC6_BH09BAC6_19000 [soil metagenome]|jgi:exopolyphosphatase/guanosine-5'-triphosphate,3'-diphosphate pyrophosphatase
MKSKKTPAPAGGGWAVMDLGTNVFHLLIVDADQQAMVRENVAVKLGEGGINEGLIQPAAFERGLAAMQQFNEHLLTHSVKKAKAIATSALRNARNGQQFIDDVKATTGIAIEIIDGDKEAEYIYRGVKAAGCLSGHNTLIIDIGGGSVEFIICNSDTVHWKQSFEIGAARMMDKFHQTDPIPPESIAALNTHLEDNLKALFAAASTYPIDNAIGSAGSFETYAELAERKSGNPFNLEKIKQYAFDQHELLSVLETLVRSTHQERVSNKTLIPVRVDMIVSASLITLFILKKLRINKVMMSTSSLKEGVLAEMMDL